MARWIRCEYQGRTRIGTLEDEQVTFYEGSLFDNPKATQESAPLSAVKLLTPTEPTKMVALWNNFHQLAAKLNLSTPPEPLYFIKASSSFHPGGQPIRRPKAYDGKVVFEGELGVVIGKRCKEVSEADAPKYIFGYTCINDVTAAEILNKDPSFAQWTRAKSFDTFGVFGPVVATGLDPAKLVVKTHLDETERQNYPVSDMVFQPARLVSLISQDMTLMPGDVIACGTNVGVGSMKPGSRIEISIDGVGTLSNTFD
jgi:2-keto-4-pentenoate hydratase/2-oxohepta-3-ene-1,7-dioic acid hydratase in catechol pathway